MILTIQQEVKRAKDDRWDWSVWIDGPDVELDQISSVEYVLHPTYPNPVRKKNRRENKFRLDSSGWGEFEIHANVSAKDGRSEHLRHWLRLSTDGDDLTSSSPVRRPTVFLTADVADAEWEEAFRGALSQRGVDVLTASDIPTGLPIETAINSILDKTDGVVEIFSEKTGSWTGREVSNAIDKDVSVVPVVIGSDVKIPARLRGRKSVHISRLEDINAAAGQIVDNLPGLSDNQVRLLREGALTLKDSMDAVSELMRTSFLPSNFAGVLARVQRQLYRLDVQLSTLERQIDVKAWPDAHWAMTFSIASNQARREVQVRERQWSTVAASSRPEMREWAQRLYRSLAELLRLLQERYPSIFTHQP